MPAYYSEFDPKAAAWLRELIKRGLIADGVVDERDLWDVSPAELAGFTQVHLCAGIGVWSYALRSAGWSDDRPVWTGSFPCQPFSAAGKGEGFADERHLWPAGCHLIAECRPAVIFGEQVASKDAEPWLDLVQADLEAMGYAVGAVPFPAAGIGAPHIRDRLYWVAESANQQHEWAGAARGRRDGPADLGAVRLMADASGPRLPLGSIADDGRGTVRLEGTPATQGELSGGLAHGNSERQPEQHVRLWEGRASADVLETAGRRSVDEPGRQRADRRDVGPLHNGPPTGPTNGLWRDADWLFCRDGKWRPVEPGTFPLAHGAPARVGRLRGYGNAINAEAAKVFIEAYLDTRTIEAGA